MADKNQVKKILQDLVKKKDQGMMQQSFSEQVLGSVSKEIATILTPVIDKIQQASVISSLQLKKAVEDAIKESGKGSLTAEDLKSALSEALEGNKGITSDEIAQAFEGAVGKIKISVPNVNVGSPQAPVVNVPPFVMPDKILSALEYDNANPLPVILMDRDGKPFQFIAPGATGGKADFLTIKDIRASSVSLIDQDLGALKVTGSFSANLSADTGSGEIGSNTLRIVQATNAVSSVIVNEIFGTTGANAFNPDGRLKVELPTGSSGLTDAELRASHLDVQQVSGSADSVNVISTVGLTDSELRASAIDIKQLSGSSDSVNVVSTVGLTDTELRASAIDIRQVSGSEFSTVINGSIETKQVSGFADSVFVTGFADSTTVHQARTTNPTAKSDGADVRPSADDLGRTITRPIQVRDLIATAYVALSTGTETTLLAAGGAGVFHDCIMITATNNSTAATQLDIRSSTGGSIIHTMYLPASTGPVGWSLQVPWPQDNANNNWTIDMPDQTGTTVYVSALFSKEI